MDISSGMQLPSNFADLYVLSRGLEMKKLAGGCMMQTIQLFWHF